MTPTESTASCNAVRILTHEEFAARTPQTPSPFYVKIDRHSNIPIDRQKETAIDRQTPAHIDRCAPLTYRVQMPKIDVARLNALMPQPKPSNNPPEATRGHHGAGFQRSGNQNRNFYGQRSNFNQSSQQQKPYNNYYISNNRGYGNSYYQKPPLPTQESKIEEMLDRVLEGQQRMTVVQTGEAVKRQAALTRGVGDDVTKRHVNATIYDDFWQVVKQEKLQERDFQVDISMSFGGSHWCRSTPDFEYRSTDFNHNRSTGSSEHRSMTPMESTASCNAVRILTHEEFAARNPHTPSPFYVKIDRHSNIPIDRQKETAIDRQTPAHIDRCAPLTYRVQMPR
ncbi:hypothetical protein F2Q69_00058795 [Brassica cretica]|uniref:Uncharacterized protein n=1 Tax=Brassica cretica TaxID=69181 RepID=A0A8S9RC60_BRACR|nr:hypothetical protein F2Q69_00058795 [Brassica cretica]